MPTADTVAATDAVPGSTNMAPLLAPITGFMSKIYPQECHGKISKI